MKKIAVVASTVMAVGLLAVSGANAFAANTNSTSTSVTTSLAQTKLSFEEMEAKVKEELAQSLADGKITQEQYDQAISDIAEGKMPEMFDKGRGGHGEKDRTELTEEQKAEMQTKMKERFAQLLADGKITQEQYDQAMSDIAEGKMPEMFDRGQDGEKDRPELTEEQKAEMQTKMKERFAQLLADGKITQEQYDQAISDLADGKMPEMPGRDKDESGEKSRPELTEEQKSEMLAKIKEKLPQLLSDGKITQEQYDQALNDIAESKMPEIPGIGRGGSHGNKTEGTTEA